MGRTSYAIARPGTGRQALIAIVNYGLGNVQAFANIYKRLGMPVRVACSAKELQGDTDKIILPGVGAFDWAMSRLNESGMRPVLENLVILNKIPVLGVCVGMQILARRSDEGQMPGLGWIAGEVKKFGVDDRRQQVSLPHMGWNDVGPRDGACLFRGMEKDARFYFLHSYYFKPQRGEDTLSVTDYHGEFASGVRFGNVYGVQFHPEKSHGWGIHLLKNFAEL